MSQVIDWPRYTRWTWGIALLLVLLLLGLWLGGRCPLATPGCCGAAPAGAAAASAQLGFSMENGKLVLTGALPQQAAKERLLQSVAAVVVTDGTRDRLRVDAAAGASPCAARAADIAVQLSQSGALAVVCEGGTVRLRGDVDSEATRRRLGDWAVSLFGTSASVVNELHVVVPALAPAAVPAAATAAPFGLLLQQGKWRVTGAVPDQDSRERVLGALRGTFGSSALVDELQLRPGALLGPCAARLDGLLAWLRKAAGVGLTCEAGSVTLSGEVASEEQRSAHLRWLRDYFGADTAIVDQLRVVAAVVPASKAEEVKCADRMGAMVTFHTGSAQIDETGHQLLDAVAACFQQSVYEISGHTDSVASDDINNPLSQQRADAVRNYLIGKGVPADNLVARGYGSYRPIADNDSEEGRARNRRIEFQKM
ncbi:outer membrane protein OmpA-like peptidoglycan-associated protein [Tahibacter aquaticus]|uniref:Outer membrane protein OmpA-like peptidoglycan-associated protein n=1 Tax=Tahibacter aquaticus TaxID=520092 RepID=A0A4R6Z938_9GAMM|nr:OmpA family protein [Tahibacter aquaticus]TDR48400.1 outer membrane protein OmpA-like peptidoglycan-associated protein [Tahibacter aquaticus]